MKVIRGLNEAEYHAWEGASASRLKAILRSPRHMRVMDGGGIETDAMRFGTALHTRVLEPETFAAKYAVIPPCDRRTKDGKAAYETFVGNNAGKAFIDADDSMLLESMAFNVAEHPTARELLDTRTETELSLFWEADGVPCKCRMDAINEEWGCIVDLKSTIDASPSAWTRSLANFKYHVQAAWYLDAANLAGFKVDSVVFIAVEKSKPNCVACYRIDEASIEEGRKEAQRALYQYADCRRTGVYPGYSDGIIDITLARWAFAPEEETL